ncbi:dTDP-4-dehydrorhamnose reductase [Sphingomonas sp. PP-F2F-G114-C0414]|uniref:dTDP-4-dehydrorhamnose reductase n=1 Tax=Sphingomonas sp. PP-F2F-G114-C0414 TaxID=2135662 RepID=UPI000F257304|nr:dTDP-4-dehydrorhamnose reductase [Sphingomonas sp. PP-F2F-G114-C0414]RMB25684.1 dTDP-4-dehydrorhamnose reductase [Sphingomonas sp. PP-F2F-G114-C0414]
MTDAPRAGGVKQILVTGGNGQLGTELKRYSWPEGWAVTAIDIDELDLRDTDAIAAMVASEPWAAVISAGAYTAVDKAESDIVTAWAVNALAPAAFAEGCAKAGIPIVQVSTDYVFDGARDGAWEVTDPVAPLGVYGASKLGGELAVRTSGARHAIVRTAWVVSAHGSNFVKTMLRVGATNPTLRVVDDQHGSPTSAADLAAALATITMRLVDDPVAPTGTYHFSNAGAVTCADFAREIFVQSAVRGGARAEVQGITTAEYPTPATRPANSLLSHDAITRDYGIHPPAWQTALGNILDELLGAPKKDIPR